MLPKALVARCEAQVSLGVAVLLFGVWGYEVTLGWWVGLVAWGVANHQSKPQIGGKLQARWENASDVCQGRLGCTPLMAGMSHLPLQDIPSHLSLSHGRKFGRLSLPPGILVLFRNFLRSETQRIHRNALISFARSQT